MLTRKEKIIFITLSCIAALKLMYDYGALRDNCEIKQPHAVSLPEAPAPKVINTHLPVDSSKKTNKPCESLSILEQQSGKWVPRVNLTKLYITTVHETNARIRRFRNVKSIPNIRSDEKCGLEYAVNNSQAQCDAKSSKPCCNEIKGVCGNGPEYCECIPDCNDYSNIINPELMDWKETYCPLEDYNAQSTCDFLQERYSSVTFIGDSLVRHMFQGLMIHLTDDQPYGSLQYTINAKELKGCGYEMQFAETYCRSKLALLWDQIKDNPRYCSRTTKRTKTSFYAGFRIATLPEVMKVIDERLKEERPLFAVHIGTHDHFPAEKVWNSYTKPIVEKLRANMHTKPSFVWIGGNTNGPIKKTHYIKTQGSRKAWDFTNSMSKYLAAYNLSVFDNFLLTNGVYSFDGTHFGSTLNQMKIKMFIKTLRYNTFQVV